MYCPLKFNTNTVTEEGTVAGTCQCEMDNCEWWHAKDKKCTIMLIAENIELSTRGES